MFARAVVLVALLTALATCTVRPPKGTRTMPENPIVTIDAGLVALGSQSYMNVWYVIDKETQTCWMMLGDAAAQLDCCALRRVSAAQPYIGWTDCPGDAPRPPATTPAASPDAH